ncbi:MAG: quinolinate synthase NadA [Candidatus Caldatribacterium sp.]|uniref:quinolinate synthase NadA n=1 Tax=Candidatus Caldatribacterium sp. TaxID=2282143 RepID=UPI002997788D|nr:quinolinate synthase NadA [Candidatus Caldatribacterium sp.]MCX7729779.1 quinolinate synthase NadA [Candidatus Caldatribacterium sp.]MDW8081897.1 quinolinate synthase NadA [Candidatus Calescibacterium sp.]
MTVIERIRELKTKKNAIILAHNYTPPEVQEVADFVGDSLGLSITAKSTPCDIIVFCGVHFMAETAKLLSPEKKVLVPDPEAGCPMADMLSLADLKNLKARHPNARVLCYVNTHASVKAECDLVCTSANAAQIVERGFSPDEEIIFVPDQYLARYVASRTGREFILFPGYCPVHVTITEAHILEAKRRHPKALVLAHPECRPEVLRHADAILSTEGMCRYVRTSPSEEFIIATEVGIIPRMRKENPAKRFIPAFEGAICENMKKNTLEKVLTSLEEEIHEVTLPEDIIQKGRQAIERMLVLSR